MSAAVQASGTRLVGVAGLVVSQLLVLAAAFGSGWLLYSAFVDGPPAQLALRVALVYFGWVLLLAACMAVHEAGHLLGGKLAGMRALFVTLGPVAVFNAAGGARYAWNRAVLTRPFACAFATSRERDEPRRWLLVFAGGPLASALLAAASWLAATSTAGTSLAVVLHAVALFALAGFVANIVPGRAAGIATDGALMLAARERTSAREAQQAVARLIAEMLDGTRPRDLHDGDLALALEAGDSFPARAGAELLALQAARDRGDEVRSRAHAAALESAFASLPPLLSADVAVELASVHAMWRDAPRAREWLQRAARAEAGSRALAEAALALAEGRTDDMRRALRIARKAIARSSFPGLAVALADQCDELERGAAC